MFFPVSPIMSSLLRAEHTSGRVTERAGASSHMGPDGSNDTPASLLELAGEGVIEKGIEMGEGSEGKRGVPPVHG